MISSATSIIYIYKAALLLNTFLALGLAVFVFKSQHKPCSRWLGWIMLAGAWWSLTNLGELLVHSLPEKIFWSKIHYFGAVSVPVFVLFFTLEYCGHTRWLNRRAMPLYWIMPVIAIILAWTNPWHNLVWTDFTPYLIGDTTIVIYGHGPGYWAMIVYSYLCLLVSIGLLVRAAYQQQSIYRRQAIFLVLIILMPWLGEIAYNLRFLPGLDFTVFGLTIAGALLAWNLGYFNLLNLMPIATDRVFAEMQHAVVVLDDQQRVVNFNPAAEKILGLSSAAVGQPATANLMACLDKFTTQTDYIETNWPGSPPRLLQVTTSPLTTNRGQVIGQLLVCRDITQYKQAQEKLWLQQLDVALLEERQLVSRELHSQTRQVLEEVARLAQNATYLLEDEKSAEAATSLAQLIEIIGNAGANIDLFVQQQQAGPNESGSFPSNFFEALTNYIHYFSQTHNLSIALTHPALPVSDWLTSMAKIQLLRIIQQALLIVTQAGQKADMQIIITYHEGWLQTIITEVEDQAVPPLLQLRAISVGGNMKLRAALGHGSHWIIQLPCHQPVNHLPLANTRVLLVDDHKILLEGFKDLLERQGLQVVGIATSGEQAIKLAHRLSPTLVLMDVRLPGMSGIEAMGQIKAELPDVKVVLLTVSQKREDLVAALRNGADGYLLKTLNPDEFFNLLNSALNGDKPVDPVLTRELVTSIAELAADEPVVLTSQQLDVLRMVAQGATYRQVGDQLHLSEHTVRYHIEQIRTKLNASNRAEAVARAIQLGLVDAPS